MMETSLCSSICTQEESVNLYFIEPEGDESPSDVLLCSQLVRGCGSVFGSVINSVCCGGSRL